MYLVYDFAMYIGDVGGWEMPMMTLA